MNRPAVITAIPVAALALASVVTISGRATASGSPAGDIPYAATRLAPDALGQDGQITLSPGFAPDGKTMFFAQAACERIWECPQYLMRSQKTGDAWSPAQIVPLPQKARGEWPSVSPDGRTLLFSWAPERDRHAGQNVREDFDLYRLDLTRTDAIPQPIDDPDINRIRGGSVRTLRFVNNETAPVLTVSGDLYFWSERLDGPGLRDIYVARSDGEGGFQRPEPLPSPINGPGEDDGSWVTADGRLMLLSTSDPVAAPGSETAADIFFSVRDGDGWSVPEPLGPAVNTRHSEFAGRITPDGRTLVFTSDRPVGNGEAGLLQVWQVPLAGVPELERALKGVTLR